MADRAHRAEGKIELMITLMDVVNGGVRSRGSMFIPVLLLSQACDGAGVTKSNYRATGEGREVE